MNDKDGPHISMVEGMCMIMIGGFMDLLEFLLDLFFGIGLIFDSLLDIFDFLVFQFWFRMKGVKTTAWLAGSAIEFIPVINTLPVRTATIILTIAITNNPKLAATAKVAGVKPAA